LSAHLAAVEADLNRRIADIAAGSVGRSEQAITRQLLDAVRAVGGYPDQRWAHEVAGRIQRGEELGDDGAAFEEPP